MLPKKSFVFALDQHLQLVDLGPALTVADVLEHIVGTNIESQRLPRLRIYFWWYVGHGQNSMSQWFGPLYKSLC